MAEQKLRRKSFIASMGAVALGMVGLRAGTPASKAASSPTNRDIAEVNRVQKDPRSIPCSGRTL